MRQLTLRQKSSALTIAALCPALTACWQQPSSNPQAAAINFHADADAGAKAISLVGCGACHTIPGIAGAHNQMANRIYIAGLLRSTPENMITWLREPQRIVPGNAMPNMGLSQEDARNITAYLYTLR
jgi:cytochrome c2